MVEIRLDVDPAHLGEFLDVVKPLPWATLLGEWDVERWSELNEFLGRLPDELLVKLMYDWQAGCGWDKRHRGALVPRPWRGFNNKLSPFERSALTTSLYRVEVEVETLGELREMTVDDLDGIEGIGTSRALFLYSVFKKREEKD